MPRVVFTPCPAGPTTPARGEDNPWHLTDNFNGVTDATYDVRNELTSLAQSGTGVAPKRADFAYDAAGRRTTLTRYSDLAGTQTVLVTAYTYDAANRLTDLTHKTSGGTVRSEYTYTLDAANRLTQEARTWTTSGGGTAGDTVGYGYTNNDQLTGVTHTNGSFANETFSFDAVGNRTMSGYSTQAGNRLTTDGTYTYGYDDEGNLTSKTQNTTGNQTLYTYDYRDRLTEVGQVVGGVHSVVAQYTYDALDRRIKDVVGSTVRWTAYDGLAPVLDFNGSGAVTARYLQGPAADEVLARETSGGAVSWYLADREGTIRDLADNTGAIVDHVDYNAFGQVVGETAPAVGDRFKYAGMEYDGETGLYHALERTYDPATGRWTSQDPIAFEGGDTDLYRYVGNSPLDFTDPWGLQGGVPGTYKPHPWPVPDPNNTIVFIGPAKPTDPHDSHNNKVAFCKQIGIPNSNVFEYNGTKELIDAYKNAYKLGLKKPHVVTWGHARPGGILVGVRPDGSHEAYGPTYGANTLGSILKNLGAADYYNLGCNTYSKLGGQGEDQGDEFFDRIRKASGNLPIWGTIGFDMPGRTLMDEIDNGPYQWYMEPGSGVFLFWPGPSGVTGIK